MYYEDSNKNKLAGIQKLINISSRIIHQLKHVYFSIFCTNVSKIQNQRSKCVCTCTNSTMKRNSNSLYLKKSKNIRVYKNKKPNLYLKNLPENYCFDNINNCTSFSSKASNSNFNKICFSNEKENKEKNKNTIVSNNYFNFSKSQYFYNGNENGNYSLYYFKDNQNNSGSNNDSNKQIFNNNSTYYSKERKSTAKIKLSNYKNNLNNFYHKNNSNNNKNTSIIKYSTNIVSNNKKKLKENYNYNFLSSNNFSMPKKMDKIKNITYARFYNNNSSFNKDQKNKIFSDRVYNRSYKTILNEDNNENKYANDNELLDQQILDYLNQNNEEKRNLIKKMKNQKIFYKKTMAMKNMLNMNEICSNKEIKNKNNKIINLNNLNNYSYVNNNYNYYCSNNNLNSTYNNSNNTNNTNNDNSHLYKNYNNHTYNNYELLISKHNNSSKKRDINMDNSTNKSLYPNYIKSKLKKPMNKKYPLRINNFTNENIDINNIIRNESLLYKNQCNNNIRNYPYNKTFKDLAKTQFIKPLNHDYIIYNPANYKMPLSDPRVASSQNIFQSNQNFAENNASAKNIDIDGNNSGVNNKTFIGKIYKDKININKAMMKKNLSKNMNKNVIQKSYDLFFCNCKISKNKNEKNIIPVNKKMNTPTNKLEKPEKVNLKKKIPYNHNHKKSNSINSIINNKKNKNNVKITYNVTTEKSIKSKDSDKFEKKEVNRSDKGSESLRMSVQSINDSKIMEMADKFIVDEENLDKNEIAEILNSKKREL